MVTKAIGVTSVWDLVPDDAQLYSSVFQEHFADTNLQVIAIFKVRAKVRAMDCVLRANMATSPASCRALSRISLSLLAPK